MCDSFSKEIIGTTDICSSAPLNSRKPEESWCNSGITWEHNTDPFWISKLYSGLQDSAQGPLEKNGKYRRTHAQVYRHKLELFLTPSTLAVQHHPWLKSVHEWPIKKLNGAILFLLNQITPCPSPLTIFVPDPVFSVWTPQIWIINFISLILFL